MLACFRILIVCVAANDHVFPSSAALGSNSVASATSANKAIIVPGQIVFGGLFPLHEAGVGGEACGAIKEEKGMQRAEAMLYAIDRINRDETLLPGVRLGCHILDTCLRDTFALEQSLEFIKPYMSSLNDFDGTDGQLCADGRPPPRRQPSPARQPVAGVIGASASAVSVMVANMLRLFKIPQISYASTGIELSDKSRFGYFSRVVPPDTYQAQALVDVVNAFGWSYVSTLADEGNYGERGIAAFEKLAVKSGICISKSLKIPRDVRNDTLSRLLNELREPDNKARVVVMFVNEDNCRQLLNATISSQLTDAFYWLASDSWGAKTVPVDKQEKAAEGTVTILPQREVIHGFDDYFTRLTPLSYTRNPWFVEFWQSYFDCIYFGNSSLHIRHMKTCTGRERISPPKYKQEGVVQFVIDAVYAMAHAVHNMIKVTCRGRPFCSEVNPPDGATLLSYIRNVSFIGSAGQRIEFNENGDAKGRYSIYQFQRVGDTDEFQYVLIGNWTDSLKLNVSLTRWKHQNTTVPVSVCSEPCRAGHVKKVEGLDTCCWVCIQCREYEIITPNEECVECPNGTYPSSSNHTQCVPIPVDYMSLGSTWAIVPVLFSVLGILTVIFVFCVFVRYDNTPVIMASGRELCYVLMAGMLMCYGMTFVIIARPSMFTCTLFRAGLGLSLALCYSALFTKTNRISRIFNRGLKAMVKRPSYTSPRSQLAICFCLVGVQAIGAATWIGMDLPHTTLVYPDRKTVVLKCKSTNVSIVLSLMYNMVLILLCTVYAFKTRKIPENFNETKYIAFTMYSTCIVWLAFIPIYFGTDRGDFKVHVTALSMCVSISASVALACLFIPKVYIVLFQPHKNVRQGATKMKGLATAGRSFFGCPSSAMNALDVACPTGLAMLIAQGTNQSGNDANNACNSKQQDKDSHVTAALLSTEPIDQQLADRRIDKWESINDLNSIVQQTSVIADAYDDEIDRETDL